MATTAHLTLRASPAIRSLASALSILFLASLASAQTNFPEVEPNSNKSEATSVGVMTAGDTITGITTGSLTTAGSTLATTGDNFRVRTAALPLGIYRHTLTITSSTVGHVGSIRGLNQLGTTGVGGTAGTADVSMQTSSTLTVPPRTNTWYGFGKQDEIYYRVTGTATTTAAYTSTLSTSTITPTVVGPFIAGPITITTVGQGHTTDTDFWVYDSNFNAISTAGNDQFGTSNQSNLVRTYGPGTYYIALSTYNLANNQVSPADEGLPIENLLDFPNCVANNDTSAALTALNVSISDGTTTTPVLISRSTPHEIVWICFSLSQTDTVLAGSDIFVSPAGQSSADFGPTPLPPGFFGPGSDPFGGVVSLGGSPLVGTGLPGGVDTIVRRPLDAVLPGCPGTTTIPIELVALDLVSTNPIVVTFNGGTNPTLYDVRFAASTLQPSPPGQMSITRTSVSGGVFDSQLPVITRAAFNRVSGTGGQPNVNIDPAPPVILNVSQAPWSYDEGGIGVPHTPGGLVDHDANPGSPLVPFPATSNFFPGVVKQSADCIIPGVSARRVTIPHMAPNHTHVVIPPTQPAPPQCVIICQGDGTGTACPCANHSIVGDDKGCLNSLLIGGALRCSGRASIANDNFLLGGSNLLNGPGLYFQSSGIAPAGVVLGDGKLCAAVGIVRLGVVFASGNMSMFPSGVHPAIHIAGGTSAGDTRHYQLWYRDAALFCAPATNNLTNGVSVTWVP
ncbi:MAG: hypothetical protein JNL28_09285 [Planctomycetes bacterium]|nr:hypothetical protein [Planctomycetota bacterium]